MGVAGARRAALGRTEWFSKVESMLACMAATHFVRPLLLVTNLLQYPCACTPIYIVQGYRFFSWFLVKYYHFQPDNEHLDASRSPVLGVTHRLFNNWPPFMRSISPLKVQTQDRHDCCYQKRHPYILITHDPDSPGVAHEPKDLRIGGAQGGPWTRRRSSPGPCLRLRPTAWRPSPLQATPACLRLIWF